MQACLRWIRTHIWGLLVGMTVTLVTIGAFASGEFERLSLSLLDFKFKHASRIEADSRVVMIDITDFAVERIHKWPWPRKYHAWLIDALNELGARAILVDIIFDGSEDGYFEDPRLEADALVDAPAQVLGELHIDDAVWGDLKFKEALAEAGNVYLGMFSSRSYHPQYFPERIRHEAYAVIAADPMLTLDRFEAEMDGRAAGGMDWVPETTGRGMEQSDRSELFELTRIEFALDGDFGLETAALASRAGLPEARVRRFLAMAKRNVARRLVARFRESDPEAGWAETFAHILPGESIEVRSADREDLLRAFRVVTSALNVRREVIPVDPSLVGKIRNVSDTTYPLDLFTEVARAGLVMFEADAADGVMRRVPLVVNDRGRLIKHLGFALACDVLEVDDRTIRLEEGNVLTMRNRSGDRSWRIRLDDQGWSLVNWHTDREHRDLWQRSFDHIPVSRVLSIPLTRDRIEKAEGREVYARSRYVVAAAGAAQAAIREYAGKVNRRKELRREAATGESSPELAKLEQEIRSIEESSISAVGGWGDQIIQALGPEVDQSALSEDERTIFRLARERPKLETLAAETTEFIAQRRADIRDLIRELRPRIAGNICLIGYTATAVADTVNTPVFDEVPGVMAHANVINSMLVDEFPETIPPIGGWFEWFDVLLILLTGTLLTVITVWRDPWFSVASMVLVVVGLHAVALALFYIDSFHVDVVFPLIAGFLSWAFVTLYRQLTEERQKRAFSKSLAQYTSPAIAAQLADQLTHQGSGLDLSPRAREVTCFFSDLKGFTSISERLGASRTREVLNPYLEAMSQVLIESNAMINKFMGDGIFAFFNPPIHPVENHARAACEATLESFVALDRLKDDLGHGELEAEVRAFQMRIGVNTGEVFVGDYGSSNKLDYTCIGDTVNLSARLEPACKPFGIWAMVSESTLKAAGDGYVVRHLGGLQVVGKTEAVQVYELIGREGEVDGGVVEYAGLFGEAVTKFQARDWEAALRVLGECRKLRPDDLAVDLLEKNVRIHQETPPPADWNRAIELTTK